MTTPVYESVAYLAADKFAVFNPAGDSFVSEFAPGLRLRADCGTDGVLFGTVAAASFEAATGRTEVTTAMDGGAALTANLAEVLHGNDLPASLCAHAALHAIGGRDALPAASTGVSGLVALASSAETRAAIEAAKAVTPVGLAAAAKGLIAANMTLYVATTGSDASGDGSSAAPYASIARALSSIANKLIASGVVVTIQVADGTYAINTGITVDHPDADKIQILGNTSTSLVAIVAVDPTTKTITITGDYASVILGGDYVQILGSSTDGLNGAYIVSNVAYSGGNTVITCAGETFSSPTVGGGSLAIMSYNRCVLNASVLCFYILKAPLLISGFRINSASGNDVFYLKNALGGAISKIIVNSCLRFLYSEYSTGIRPADIIIVGANLCAVNSNMFSSIVLNSSNMQFVIKNCAQGFVATYMSFIFAYQASLVLQNVSGNTYSPALNSTGNSHSTIAS